MNPGDLPVPKGVGIQEISDLWLKMLAAAHDRIIPQFTEREKEIIKAINDEMS